MSCPSTQADRTTKERLLALLRERARRQKNGPEFLTADGFRPDAYAADPVGYARDILGVSWWQKQQDVALAYVKHERILVKASHGVGKTHLMGGLVNHHFDSYSPGLTLTTAPTARQVYGLLWKEVRLQRRGRGMLPKAARIEGKHADGSYDPGHLAEGYTAKDEHSFQGQHDKNLLIVIDEACGVSEEILLGVEGMASSGEGNRVIAILNPTDSSSPIRQRELQGGWHVITISALDHPNIAAQLRGLPKPYPKAVDLRWLEDKLLKWCSPIPASEHRPTDIVWPPLDFCRERGISPRHYRPGPLFEGKVLGRWPSLAVDSVWSDFAWEAAVNAVLDPARGRLQVGVDVARFGDDDTCIHVRKGGVSLYHEHGNGWSIDRTVDRVKAIAHEHATKHGIKPNAVPLAIDDCGVGGGVTDYLRRDGWRAVPVNPSWEPPDPDEFLNLRSALWFNLADEAALGRLSFARLDDATRAQLRLELQSPRYTVDARGRRVVEPKDRTKTRLGRSPDNADAVMLSYAAVDTIGERTAGRIVVPT